MLRALILLSGMLFAVSTHAQKKQDLISNLKSRLYNLSGSRGKLIKSYTDHSQSYIYDQALAIIAFSKEGDQKNARALLKAMESLQDQEGSLFFSYNLDGSSPYPQEGDKRISGSIAWVALAASHYQNTFVSHEFVTFNKKILSYLHSQIGSIQVLGMKTKALRFSPTDFQGTSFNETHVAALEHNLDAYAAFTQFEKLNGNHFKETTSELRRFILSLWDEDKNHFWSGANFQSGQINKAEFYLDNQTWSILALSHEDLQKVSGKKALEMNCQKLLVTQEGLVGFMDMRATRYSPSQKYIWSEGTLGHYLAMKKMNQTKCQQITNEDFLDSIKKMKMPDNGIAYATERNENFSSSSSVAGTSWMYFSLENVNPFEVN